MSELVLTETLGNVAVLTLNRPERHNSLIPELLRELLGAQDDLRAMPELRAVILQANGRSFSTGGDVRAFYNHRSDLEEYSKEVVGLLNQAILALVTFPSPVIAAVHGIVTGGALGLVLAADIVLVAPEVTFTPFYGTVGFSPDGGWSAMLPALISVKRAAQVLLLDQSITAQEAVNWGMASRIVPADRIRTEARAVADALVRQVPGSIRHSKSLLWGNSDILAARLGEERQQFIEQIVTDQARKGMAAFLATSARRP